MSATRPYVLSIAGFDPCSGAGITADIKTFENHCVYGLSVVTAITFQNHNEFFGVSWMPVDEIIKQLDVLFNQYPINVAKIGLIEELEVINIVINRLKTKNPVIKIIWDPILTASAGYTFHSEINYSLLDKLITQCKLITPNYNEAITLFKNTNIEDENHLLEIVKQKNINALLLKGGHNPSNKATDLLIENNLITSIVGQSIEGVPKHGTGCVLSASIAANLALGESLLEACKKAKNYIHNFILSNSSKLGYHHLF